LAARRVRSVIWKRGELENCRSGASVDVALLYGRCTTPRPGGALANQRDVVPGARLVLDLREHDERWVRDRLGDRWLGFSDEALAKLLKGAGLTDVQVNVGARRTGDPFTVIVASGVKPGSRPSKSSPPRRAPSSQNTGEPLAPATPR
jgi:ArsR family transcriptional regulator